MIQLNDMHKYIVISGASMGIGRAIALVYAKNNYNVAVCARNIAPLEELRKELYALNPKGKHIISSTDMSNKKEVYEFAKTVNEEYPHINILINNAGYFIPGKIIEEDDDVLEKMIQTNLMSAYYLTKGILPSMMKRKDGQIFNICSIAGLQAYSSGGSYSITKFALNGFSKALREELKEYHIKVTAVHPGATLTNSWAGVELPESRFIKAEDIAQNIYDISCLSKNSVVEDIVIRPQLGDI
jgi:short-subunit dehydrogenase